MRCGYNLRGLTAAMNCPECGVAIARSLDRPWTRLGSAARVQRIARSMALRLASLACSLFSVAWVGAFFFTRGIVGGVTVSKDVFLYTWNGILTADAALTIWSAWLITSTPRGHVEEQREKTLRQLVRGLAVVFLAIVLFLLAGRWLFGAKYASTLLGYCPLIVTVAFLLAELLWYRRLVSILGNRTLRGRVTWLIWGLMALMILKWADSVLLGPIIVSPKVILTYVGRKALHSSDTVWHAWVVWQCWRVFHRLAVEARRDTVMPVPTP